MHERKRIMPSAQTPWRRGVGTLEELVEQITWAAATRSRSDRQHRSFWDRFAPCSSVCAVAFIRPGFPSTCWWRTASRTSCRLTEAARVGGRDGMTPVAVSSVRELR
jgi:hypothetical protein